MCYLNCKKIKKKGSFISTDVLSWLPRPLCCCHTSLSLYLSSFYTKESHIYFCMRVRRNRAQETSVSINMCMGGDMQERLKLIPPVKSQISVLNCVKCLGQGESQVQGISAFVWTDKIGVLANRAPNDMGRQAALTYWEVVSSLKLSAWESLDL